MPDSRIIAFTVPFGSSRAYFGTTARRSNRLAIDYMTACRMICGETKFEQLPMNISILLRKLGRHMPSRASFWIALLETGT